jgi:hypothetical protein
MDRSFRQRMNVPALSISPQAVIRDGFPAAVGFSPRSRRDPRALARGARMEFFPIYLRRSSAGRERGTLRFRQYVDIARGDTAHRVQEVLLTPAGGPTFVLLRCAIAGASLGEGRHDAITYLAAPEVSSGRSRWARLDRGDEVTFDLRFPYDAGPGDRVCVLGIHPGEISRPSSVLFGLGELSGWRLSGFDERLVHGLYWHRLASGVLAPHSGSLRRQVTIGGLDERGLWELGVALGLPLARGRRYHLSTLEPRLRALHGHMEPLTGRGSRTETYCFRAGACETLWAVYGLYTAYGLEAPHLRRVLELIEQRPIFSAGSGKPTPFGGPSLADAGYRFELACPEIPELFGGTVQLPVLDDGEGLTAETVVKTSPAVFDEAGYEAFGEPIDAAARLTPCDSLTSLC